MFRVAPTTPQSGYREALIEGKDRTRQSGFNAGFRQGAAKGHVRGAVLGRLRCVRVEGVVTRPTTWSVAPSWPSPLLAVPGWMSLWLCSAVVASAAAGLDVEARARVVAELAAACSRLALSDDDIEGGPADVVAVVAPIVRQCCPEEDVAAIVARVCG